MTPARLVALVVAAAVGFVVGFYAGFFALLSIVGLDEFQGWQFPVATVPSGGLGAGLAATAASPSPRRWSVVVTTSVVVAGAMAGGLIVAGGDYAVAIGFGGLVVVAATAIAARVVSGTAP
jgi:hypothetical protein